jgi:hypothetical protein
MAEADLAPLIERIARDPASTHHHEVRVEATGPLPARFDDERLGLALGNLLHEVCRRTPAGSPVSVRAAPAGDRVEIDISCPLEAWQDEANRELEEYDDLGISRSVATTIVGAHGGSISELTRGAEAILRVDLPLVIGGTP